jgi:hypothetical protein
MMWAKGFAAEETKAALSREAELVGGTHDFLAYDAQCVVSFQRGAFSLARQTGETYLREAEAGGRAMEARAARRLLGLISLFKGELKSARSILERAVSE